MKHCKVLGLGLVLSLVVVTGCSGPQAPPNLKPLTGTLTKAGEKVTGGGLLLRTEETLGDGWMVNAMVDQNGSFKGQTLVPGKTGMSAFPGVPPGKYKATYHPPTDGTKGKIEIELEETITVGDGPTDVKLTIPDKLPENKDAGKDTIPTPPR